MTMEGSLAFWPQITVKRYRDILRTFGTVDNFWVVKKSEIKKLPWPPEIIGAWLNWRDTYNPEQSNLDLKKLNIKIITLFDSDYPPALAEIFDPPYALFVTGILKFKDPLLAVVGTRINTDQGEKIVRNIVAPITPEIGIVSGLAYGIDSLAHETALNANGYTIAVLGAGIDHANNPILLKKIIAKNGAVISEYPTGTPGSRFTFPRRNRIISGLARATLVIEAGEKSGALITAGCALEQNREVLCVPHSIFSPKGKGVNNLIKQGATVITSADDIRVIFNIKNNPPPANKKIIALPPLENAIINFLASGRQTNDAIARALNLPAAKIATPLTELEIKGIIQALPGNHYSII